VTLFPPVTAHLHHSTNPDSAQVSAPVKEATQLQISAEPGFSTKAVQKVCHDAESGEREGYGRQPDKAGKEEPIRGIEPRQQGTERKVDTDKEVYITFEIPPVGLHEIKSAIFERAGKGSARDHRTCAEKHEDIPDNAEAGKSYHKGAESNEQDRE